MWPFACSYSAMPVVLLLYLLITSLVAEEGAGYFGSHLFVKWVLSVVVCLLFLFVSSITKTCLYNFEPLKPHFYIIKLRFTGVYIIFLISAQNIDCGYLLKPPRRGGSNGYQQSMF